MPLPRLPASAVLGKRPGLTARPLQGRRAFSANVGAQDGRAAQKTKILPTRSRDGSCPFRVSAPSVHGRADFARVGGDVLGSLDLAQQLGGVTADAQIVDLGDLDLAFRG